MEYYRADGILSRTARLKLTTDVLKHLLHIIITDLSNSGFHMNTVYIVSVRVLADCLVGTDKLSWMVVKVIFFKALMGKYFTWFIK